MFTAKAVVCELDQARSAGGPASCTLGSQRGARCASKQARAHTHKHSLRSVPDAVDVSPIVSSMLVVLLPL